MGARSRQPSAAWLAQCWLVQPALYSKYDGILRHKLQAAIMVLNTSPSPETPEVQGCVAVCN